MNRWIAIGGLCTLILVIMASARPSQDEGCIRDAIYDDAVIHAGATDYVFVLSDDISLTIRVANEVSSQAGADALLTTGDDGPAEASEARLGQPHDLCQENGLIRISPSQG